MWVGNNPKKAGGKIHIMLQKTGTSAAIQICVVWSQSKKHFGRKLYPQLYNKQWSSDTNYSLFFPQAWKEGRKPSGRSRMYPGWKGGRILDPVKSSKQGLFVCF